MTEKEVKLIELDALMQFPIRIDHYDKENGNENFVLGIESVLEYAQSLPAIEAEPVVHARWDDSGRYQFADGSLAIRCTQCGCSLHLEEYEQYHWNYCPYCGAKMDLKDED